MAKTSKRARKSSPLNLPGAFELFTPSKELVLKNIWIFGPLYAVPLIFGIHNWIWTPANGTHHWYSGAYGFSTTSPGSPYPVLDGGIFIGFTLLWVLFVLIAGTIASVMSQSAQLRAVEGHHLDFQDLWAVVKKMGLKLLGLYIVTAVIVIIGLLLLIVPGLIFIRRYFLAPYVMIDQNVGIQEALSKSAELTKLNPGAIWGVIGVTVLIGLAGIVPFIGGLVAFALGCLYSIAPAMRYHQLKKLA